MSRGVLVALSMVCVAACDGGAPASDDAPATNYAWAPVEAGEIASGAAPRLEAARTVRAPTLSAGERSEDPEDEVEPDPEDEVEPDPEDDVEPDPEDEVEPDPEDEVEPDPEDEVEPDPEDEVEPAPHPARYPVDRIQSPITAWVAERLAEVAGADPERADDVFMKVGASGTVSSQFLKCFGTDSVDLASLDEAQVQTRAHFLAGDAGGTDPFSRKTLAAKVGMSAVWAISGSPSPLEQELAAVNPRWALVAYGSNDMQLGTTYQSALWGFGANLTTLVDQLLGDGVIPVVSTIPRRLDVSAADLWVPTYNAVIRGIAQARQVPLVDLNLAFEGLPNKGISGDGLHGSAYAGGACVFTEAGLEAGYNTRTLITLEALARQLDVVVHGAGALDAALPALEGVGAPDEPIVIDGLPFSDVRDTSAWPWAELDGYACKPEADESGPEVLYRIELTETTAVRAIVLDRGDVDIDVHVLDETATAAGCVARADGLVEATLGPGVWHFALDTFVSGGQPRAGEYIFVVHACPEGDGSCG